ncbi:TetR/AcrR family transcriptional regulator [Mycobacterium sp. Y57]|uniref:TetR/AcrR family transcriptional regulator n=1 Tax=Mycolicibacterium xanthum TaxID=2796469 RepID=UPI001C84CCDC|nr:TetR/AcrR family transcriptional regulator [Mycolicibacterium xanthum]MBX7435138.1 TetR/AcrR family transcriptional regulator [Mycolicibacterium xanthum]
MKGSQPGRTDCRAIIWKGAMPNQRSGTTRAAQAAETRQRLIDTAIDLFSDRHYDEVAVTDIAKGAGVAHGLLFHYFGNKRGIYLAAMREAATQLDAAFLIDPTLAPAEQMRHAFAMHLQYLADHRGLALRRVLGSGGADPEAWEVFQSARSRALDSAAAVLGIDPSNPAWTMMGRAAVAAIDEAALYWLNDSGQFDKATMVECFVSIVISALRGAHALDADLNVDAAIEALTRGEGPRVRRSTQRENAGANGHP